VQQYLDAGLLDEFQVHVAPVLFGDGVRLFDQPGSDQIELNMERVVESAAETHVRYAVRAKAGEPIASWCPARPRDPALRLWR
jgi:riboflavin biosynthesis pyrimidine reductase